MFSIILIVIIVVLLVLVIFNLAPQKALNILFLIALFLIALNGTGWLNGHITIH